MLARRWLVPMLAAGLLLLTAAVPAGAASSASGWRVFTTVSRHNREVQFNAVTAVSRNDAWAVGPTGPFPWEIVEHWNGHSWRRVNVPGRFFKQRVGTLEFVSATSNHDVWAMDAGGDWLHFDGSRWSAGSLPARGGLNYVFPEGLAVAGPHAVWAVGWDVGSADVPYAAYYNGSTWKPRKLPAPTAKQIGGGGLSVVSPQDVWALLGSAAPRQSPNALMHWNGREWSRVRLPSSLVRTAELLTVLAQSDGTVSVGGLIPHGGYAATPVVARLTGNSWQVRRLRAPASITDTGVENLIPDGAGGLWASGSEGCCGDLGPIWRYQSGQWSNPIVVTHTPDGILTSLAGIPGTTAAWGVGGDYGPKGHNYNEIGVIVSYGKI
jgi:hypothetical protein